MTEFFADLTGVRAKLGRANEHLSSLNNELWRLTERYADTRFTEFRCEGEWQVLYHKPIPRFFDVYHSLIAGDIFNNLRAALDHVIWQLVLREGKKPRQSNDFPIFTSEQDFIGQVKYPPKRSEKRSPLYQIPWAGTHGQSSRRRNLGFVARPMAIHPGKIYLPPWLSCLTSTSTTLF
jgi:hypothetical protein